MKILIVTTRFFPYGSATSSVVGNLAEALHQEGNEVHIAALTRYKEDAISDTWGNICVTKIYSPAMITKEQIRKEIRNNPLRSVNGLVTKTFDKIYQYIKADYKLYSLNRSIISKYRNAIENELKNKYDLCIVTLMPVEAVWVAYNIDFGNTVFVIYQLDPFWNNSDLPKQYNHERFLLEIEMVKKSCFCMTTPLIAEENIIREPELAKKYIKTDFPCLKERKKLKTKSHSSDSIVHCVFLGTLYPTLRPPEKLISIISQLHTEKISFDFYGSGLYLIEQSQDYKKAVSKINIYGQIASDVAEAMMSEADILVNIDNTSTALVPSKIFEYVSTGKPIINCYFSEKSQTLKYLEKYPLCVNVNLNDDTMKSAEKTDQFISNLKGENVPFETIQELYHRNTPVFVARQCLEAYSDRVRYNK